MAYRIAGRAAELLWQTGDSTFHMRLDNGCEITVDVMEIELVPDVELIETMMPDGMISCRAVAV